MYGWRRRYSRTDYGRKNIVLSRLVGAAAPICTALTGCRTCQTAHDRWVPWKMLSPVKTSLLWSRKHRPHPEEPPQWRFDLSLILPGCTRSLSLSLSRILFTFRRQRAIYFYISSTRGARLYLFIIIIIFFFFIVSFFFSVPRPSSRQLRVTRCHCRLHITYERTGGGIEWPPPPVHF